MSQTGDLKDDSARAAEAGALRAACLGVGCAIAATEVRRYSVLWPVGMGSSDGYAMLLVYLTAVFALLAFVRCRRGASLCQSRLFVVFVVAMSAAGFLSRALLAVGLLPDTVVIRRVISVGMETPYLLMPIWASALDELGLAARLRAVAMGIVFAGLAQMLVSLLPGTLAYAVAFSFAPASAALLIRLNTEVDREDVLAGTCPHASSRALTVSDGVSPSVVLACLLVTTSSLAIYVMHAQWTGIQDNGAASLLVQLCTGAGMLVAGSLLMLASGWLGRRDLADFCFVTLLPVLVAGLYLSQSVDGVALAVSVIPLNVAYATLLFYVWSAPQLAERGDTRRLGLLAFYLKRAGVLAGPLVWSMLSTLGIGLTWFTFGVVCVLIAFFMAYYLAMHAARGGEGRITAGGEGGGHEDAEAVSGLRETSRALDALARGHGLTPRETEVFALLARGRTASYIGRELGMSDPTVRTHISHIYRKCGVNSQQALLDVIEKDAGSRPSADA